MTQQPGPIDLIMRTILESIEERFEQYDHHKDENGVITFKERSLGWFGLLRGVPVSFWLGPTQPCWDHAKQVPLSPGDPIKIIIRKETN